jgi:hypothetical protein
MKCSHGESFEPNIQSQRGYQIRSADRHRKKIADCDGTQESLKDLFSVARGKMIWGLHTLKIGLSFEKRFVFPEPNPKSIWCWQKVLQIASEHSSICKKGSAEADNTVPHLNPFVSVCFWISRTTEESILLPNLEVHPNSLAGLEWQIEANGRLMG